MRRSADFASEFFGETSGVSLVHPHNTVVVIILDTPTTRVPRHPVSPDQPVDFTSFILIGQASSAT